MLNNSGTFNITAGGDFQQNQGNANHAINNSGTWNVSGAGFTSNVSDIAFNNSGMVNANSGTLAFNGGFLQTAGSLNLNGGSVSNSTALNIQGGSVQEPAPLLGT